MPRHRRSVALRENIAEKLVDLARRDEVSVNRAIEDSVAFAHMCRIVAETRGGGGAEIVAVIVRKPDGEEIRVEVIC